MRCALTCRLLSWWPVVRTDWKIFVSHSSWIHWQHNSAKRQPGSVITYVLKQLELMNRKMQNYQSCRNRVSLFYEGWTTQAVKERTCSWLRFSFYVLLLSVFSLYWLFFLVQLSEQDRVQLQTLDATHHDLNVKFCCFVCIHRAGRPQSETLWRL